MIRTRSSTVFRSANPARLRACLLSSTPAIALLLCFALVAQISFAADVIVNRDVPVSKLPRETLRSSFIMRKLTWPDGRPIRVFVLPDGHPLHKEFAKAVLDVYPYQLRQAWDRLVFSGTGQAPIEVASEQEMLAQVAATPGAVGYVKRKQPNDPVNVLAIE
jgi:ABC-type phosphate transport system substrate-binding protein